MKLQLFHGTSKKNAEQIEKEGFKIGKSYNWRVHSKEGFVYLSLAYAPFYCINADPKGEGLAIIKVEVDTDNLYPDEDYIMYALGKPKYTQKDLNNINFEGLKSLWEFSLKYMGNVAVQPDKVKIIGVRYFDGKYLLVKCDSLISPINFKIMGDYYAKLSKWIFEGKDYLEFPNFVGI
jgi:hypothetical protein